MSYIYNNEIQNLCNEHKVKELYLSGSALTNRFTKKSDVDLLVQFDPFNVYEYFDNYMDLKEKLEKLFERRVDLVENQVIKNPIFRKSVDRAKVLICERRNSEVSV